MLVISNNRNVAKALSDLLKSKFTVTLSNADVDEIESHLRERPYSVVIIEGAGFNEIKSLLQELESIGITSKSVLLLLAKFDDQTLKDCHSYKCVKSILTKPCSKKDIWTAVDSVLEGINTQKVENKVNFRVLHAVLEAYSLKNIILYRCYTKVGECLLGVKPFLEYDSDYMYDLFALYMITVTTLEDDLISDLMSGEHSQKKTVNTLISQIEKIISNNNIPLSSIDSQCFKDILHINKRYNGKGYPKDDLAGDLIPYASRLLRILFDYYCLTEKGKSTGECLFIMKRRTGWYDESLLEIFIQSLGEAAVFEREIYPLGLQKGMVMAQDLFGNMNGKKLLVVKKGQTLSDSNIDYIHRHAKDILDITEPVLIKESLSFGEVENA
ncbi:HD domain-containing phosphohydrolase [Maridesulfovibrio sp.]|uniref:HD domain-containing phosphohydrolase n=1 Tax=Maridesulfovibrio sp. TaxID=2795000 RepID=UPI003B003B53